MLWKGMDGERKRSFPCASTKATRPRLGWSSGMTNSSRRHTANSVRLPGTGEDLREAPFPLRRIVQHRHRIDKTKREPVEWRIHCAVRRHEVARQQQLLPFDPECELVP